MFSMRVCVCVCVCVMFLYVPMFSKLLLWYFVQPGRCLRHFSNLRRDVPLQ